MGNMVEMVQDMRLPVVVVSRYLYQASVVVVDVVGMFGQDLAMH
jgi:hypothetical protein